MTLLLSWFGILSPSSVLPLAISPFRHDGHPHGREGARRLAFVSRPLSCECEIRVCLVIGGAVRRVDSLVCHLDKFFLVARDRFYSPVPFGINALR